MTKDAYAAALTTLEKWHKRLGHANPRIVKRTTRAVEGMEDLENEEFSPCEACVLGKHHRIPFGTSTVLAEVHSDLCGPWPTRSLEGHRYFVSYIDGSSDFASVH